MGRLEAAASTIGKAIALYVVFGIAHAMVMAVYCSYRANRGNPSDLPCISWFWTPLDVAGWPLGAYSHIVTGKAVLMPSVVVRGVGIVFLGGFIATLMWMFCNRPGTSRRSP